MTLEKLATMMMGQFSKIEADVTPLKHDMFEVKSDLLDVRRRITNIERDISDMKDERVTRDEFEDHGARIKLLEKQLHITSGM